MSVLRDYQNACCDAVYSHLSNCSRRTLATLPTGTGKTEIFSHVTKWVIDRAIESGRVIILAHREELIFQAAERIHRVCGFYPSIEMGEFRRENAEQAEMYLNHAMDERVIVTTVQTQNSGKTCKKCIGTADLSGAVCDNCIGGRILRMQKFNPLDFALLIVDEAHHAVADSYRRVIGYYERNPKLKVLGVTATPDRADEEAMGKIFDSVAFEYNLPTAIADGWLVPVEQQYIQVEGLDFSQVRTTAGDLNEGDLDRIMAEETILHKVIAPTVAIAGDEPTLVFAVSVSHAERMAEIINRYKPDSAVVIIGSTPKEERRDLIRKFQNRQIQYMVSCGVFLEGFDAPACSIIAMARPTKSRALYTQAVGRGMRVLPGVIEDYDEYGELLWRLETSSERAHAIAFSQKPRVLILDFVGNSGRHKLISTADILGDAYPDEIVDAAVARAKEMGQAVDIGKLIQQVSEEEQERQKRESEKRRQQAEEARRLAAVNREHVTAQATWNATQVNPFDVWDMAPRREPGWHKGRLPSDKQIATLKRFKIDIPETCSFWTASQLIEAAIKRANQGLCTYKQAKLLQKHGYDTNMTFEMANRTIDALAKNGWKRPA